MKKSLRLFIALLLLYFGYQASFAQNYIRLTDASGLEPTASQLAELEAAADSLVAALPAEFQADFKVFDFGFYLHNEVFQGGFPAVFEQAIAEAASQSTYYLLFGRQTDETEVGLKFWIDLQLPDVLPNGCIPDFQSDATQLVQSQIERTWDEAGRSQAALIGTLISGMGELATYLDRAISCCGGGGSASHCLECGDSKNIVAKLLSLGFLEEAISGLKSDNGSSADIAEIVDHANLIFTVNHLTDVRITDSYIQQIAVYQAQGLSIRIYITSDEHLCDGVFQTIQDEVNSGVADVVFWHHIHAGTSAVGDERLFSRVVLSSDGQARNSVRKRSLGPDPVTAIIGALGSAFADAMIQATVIYFVDDDVEKGDFGAAWSKVNYGSVLWSGFTGMFVISSKALVVAKAVGAASAEVYYNVLVLPDYDIQTAAYDFVRVFVSEIIGQVVGTALGNKLKNVDINYLSIRAYGKLSSILGKPLGKLRARYFGVDPKFKEADEAKGILVDGVYRLNPVSDDVMDLVISADGIVKFRADHPHLADRTLHGNYMYVVDDLDRIVVGTRARGVLPFDGGASHPTLLGGVDPRATGAGMIEFKNGRIFRVDNASGHFKPDEKSLGYVEYLMRGAFDGKSFADDFRGFVTFN